MIYGDWTLRKRCPMWTIETCAQYDLSQLRYASDLQATNICFTEL
jgi:hypothetical protein